ncbi:hypothetical protein VTN96DRAFT_6271 [Rasamsonia emersonii]
MELDYQGHQRCLSNNSIQQWLPRHLLSKPEAARQPPGAMSCRSGSVCFVTSIKTEQDHHRLSAPQSPQGRQRKGYKGCKWRLKQASSCIMYSVRLMLPLGFQWCGPGRAFRTRRLETACQLTMSVPYYITTLENGGVNNSFLVLTACGDTGERQSLDPLGMPTGSSGRF